jgi:hypothetical protein
MKALARALLKLLQAKNLSYTNELEHQLWVLLNRRKS